MFNLWAEVFNLRRGVSDHLDPVVVVGHGAGQVGHFHQLVGVLGEDGSHLFHLKLYAELTRYRNDI